MTQNEMLEKIIRTLDSKKAEEIRAIKITDLTIIADYFVIANGTSTTQTRTLAEEVEYQLSQLGVEPKRTEGYKNGSNWVVLDYGDIVVHVFYKETRDYYQLERLWADGEKVDIEKYLI
ncbi:MAG: ribosome silencing factor [Clostridium sp.]|nr:ribosome silencing factor [Clostridium sp.]MCM1547238.1 ribosome silencing factor [Ruminococcus sp.]